MATFFLYILKSTICLILFYLGFKALMSNETFFRFNRWVLLAGLGVCLVLPLIKTETEAITFIQQPVRQLERIMLTEEEAAVASGMASDNIPVVSPGKPESRTNSSIVILWTIYLAGCSFCFIATLLSFCKMAHIIRRGRKIVVNGYTLILSSAPIAPFSWGKYIILSEEDYRFHPDEILTHEYIHLHSRHSIDLVYMEIILLLHWFNPAAWLLKRELREIHEFQADDGVIKQGIDATKYQLLLVKKAVGSSHYTLANSFNHSKIKKRITMMLKEKSNNWARLKFLLLVPVGLVTLNAFADLKTDRQLETFIQSKDNVTPSNNQQSIRSFFTTELEKYIKKVDANATLSPDEIVVFLDKNTEKQNLFVNAKGDILLNNKFVQADQLSAKLAEIFSSNVNTNKPVSFYSLIDINTPNESADQVFDVVKEAFKKQQTVVGVDKSPYLLFQDTRNNKNYPVKQKKVQEAAYYTVDGKRVAPAKFEEMRKSFIHSSPRKSDLSDATGKIVEVRSHYKMDDGSYLPSPPMFMVVAPDKAK